MDLLTEAKARIEEAIAEIDAEAHRLSEALKHLIGGSPPADGTRRPRKARIAAPKRKRKRPARKGQRREEVLKAITDDPGTTAAKVAEKLDMNPSQVSSIAKGLLSDKLVTKRGPAYTAKPQAKTKKAESATT
jgi:hypothetical protein